MLRYSLISTLLIGLSTVEMKIEYFISSFIFPRGLKINKQLDSEIYLRGTSSVGRVVKVWRHLVGCCGYEFDSRGDLAVCDHLIIIH